MANDLINELQQQSKSYSKKIDDSSELEMMALIKDIYLSRDILGMQGPRYYVSNDTFEYCLYLVQQKYTLEQMREFHKDVAEKNLLGKRKSWSLNAPIEDLDRFYGKVYDQKIENKIEFVNDLNSNNRLLHLIYEPLQENDCVLYQKPNDAINILTDDIIKNFGEKIIEVLFDWCVFHRKFGKMGKWTFESVKKDLKTAVKWSQENPQEYSQVCK